MPRRTQRTPTHGVEERHRWVWLEALMLLLILSAGAGWAAGEPPAPTLDPAGIRFQLPADSQSWALTVSGPERFHVRREFFGSAPALALVGADGKLPVDGTYVWELRRLDVDLSATRNDAWSGSFRVRDGRPVVPRGPVTEEESRATALASEAPSGAPTHDGDVSIRGRLCVGDDCDDTVPTPFETIKMIQNNAWINAVDTSPTGGDFPDNDWQIKFNDSSTIANGGADYFGIEDRGPDGLVAGVIPLRVDAGAPVDSIRVDQNGRVGLGTATPSATLQVAGDAIVDGDFTAGSSREIKHAFAPIEPRRVLDLLLELPITEWSYRADRSSVRHLGPMAEDFSAAFALGRDDRHVSPVDLSGVAFAAIQGLHQVVRDRDAEIEELRRSRDELTDRLEALEQLVRARQSPSNSP